MSEEKVVAILLSDPRRLEVLKAARSLNLPDWWIGAGFVRNPVWDHLDHTTTAPSDIDLVYFDSATIDEDLEKTYEKRLQDIVPAPWSVKNQARMHLVNGDKPYTSSLDAISKWTETATAIAVRLEADDAITLKALHGLDDLFALTARPTPHLQSTPHRLEYYRKRMAAKNWKALWPSLTITEEAT